MTVLVMYIDGTAPKEFKNVLQVDYVDYKENEYSDDLHKLSLLLEIKDKKGVRYVVDLTKDVQVTISNYKESELK